MLLTQARTKTATKVKSKTANGTITTTQETLHSIF